MTSDTPLPTGTWQIDPAETTLTVSATKLGLWTIPATMEITSGTVRVDDQHRVTDVSVVADAGSYTSKNAKRNEHIRSDDFLHADQHPEIRFEAHSATPSPDGFRASGTVTVKDTTTPLDVTITDLDIDDARCSFRATMSADREALGVDKFPNFFIARDLDIDVAATATKAS